MHSPYRFRLLSVVTVSALAGSLAWGVSPVRAKAEGEAGALPEAAAEEARKLFHDTGCSQCHALADADSYGAYGPSLDGNPELTPQLALDRITNGKGDMPSFAGILSDEQLKQLASYVAAASQDDTAS